MQYALAPHTGQCSGARQPSPHGPSAEQGAPVHRAGRLRSILACGLGGALGRRPGFGLGAGRLRVPAAAAPTAKRRRARARRAALRAAGQPSRRVPTPARASSRDRCAWPAKPCRRGGGKASAVSGPAPVRGWCRRGRAGWAAWRAWPKAASRGSPTVDSAIMAASGFPGSPSTKRPSGSSARTAGWPGRMAMPSMISRPPSSATARRR